LPKDFPNYSDTYQKLETAPTDQFIYPLHSYNDINFHNDSSLLYNKCDNCSDDKDTYNSVKECNNNNKCMPYGHKSLCTLNNTDNKSMSISKYW